MKNLILYIIFIFLSINLNCQKIGIIASSSETTGKAITLTSAVGTDNQTIAIHTPLTTITYSITGGATSATCTGLPAGIIGVFSSGTETITGIPTVSVTFTYTITAYFPGGIYMTKVGTITVTP